MSSLSKVLLSLLMLVGAAFLLFRWAGRGDVPKSGSPAPNFELSDASGKVVRLSDYGGRWLVLYFYPKDETPGCTLEACNLRDGFAEFKRRDVALVGISLDNAASHASFIEHHGLPFSLLSDLDGKVARAYGALWDFGPVRFAKRHTYLIDPQGRMMRVFLSVSPATHSAELIKEIDRIQLEGRRAATNNQDMPVQ